MEGGLKHVSTQSLECPVCLNIFTDPKILSCSHTFCKTCLDSLLYYCKGQMVQCPVCKVDTKVVKHDVNQLQDNLALKSLIEDIENQHQVCTNCKSEEKPQAIVYCQDCGKYLCTTCQTKHAQWEGFSDHEVIAMSEIESGKVSVRRFRKCRKHPREDEEFFCSDCKRFACFRCSIMEHKDKGHRVIEASAYENNHLKNVEDLKSKVDRKRPCIQQYSVLIDEQKNLMSTVKKQCIGDIRRAFDESVRELKVKKKLLIDEVSSWTTEGQTELDRMKKEVQQQIARMDTVTDLVTNVTKIPLEMDALAAHNTLCQELQDTLKQEYPLKEQPIKSIKKGKCISFKRNIDELALGKVVNLVAMDIALPTRVSLTSMATSPDGRMAVGSCKGGVAIFSANGQLQETVLKDVWVYGIAFLSDGRCAVRDTNNNITLYTAEWEKLDVRFETLNHKEGGFGGLDVDSDDQIYVAYIKAKKIQVFSTAGGKAIREIPCTKFVPWQILVFADILIINNCFTISVIDNDWNVKYKVTKAKMYGHAAVTQDNRILIAWVNPAEGFVSIDEYNKKLQHVKNLIADYKIEKPKKNLYHLREFQSREMAFCTSDRLYIFH